MDEDKRTKTLVIPTYSITAGLIDLALTCAKSHRNQVNQIIITEDGGRFSRKLRDIADIYIYSPHNVGFTKNANRGWALSTSDFTIIANSDTELVKGNIRDICVEGRVVCPEIINLDYPGFTGSYFVVPKEIWRERGMLNEEFRNFASDDDYYYRIKDIFFKEGRVGISHQKAATLRRVGFSVEEENKRDQREYDKLRKERGVY